jgi:probable HAF family extracellular repeat protein
MQRTARTSILAITLLGTLAKTAQVPGQDHPQDKPKHHQYKLYDVGTFGGPNSYGSSGASGITPAGAIGIAETPLPDPFAPNCFQDCFVGYAFHWNNGHTTDLGALPGNNGGNSSYGFAINSSGLVVGVSENGSLDPATGYPEVNAVVWKDGNIINLGTFGGTQSKAEMTNNRGQVVGLASNTILDPFSFGGYFPATTEIHAFLWEHGAKRDLGTLGGPDSAAYFINEAGQIAGQSYTNDVPNSDSGVPTIDPFLWDNGRMTDLGSFGGDLGYSSWINNRGQVVGYSYLAGDQAFHAFLWSRGVLNDLGTLGGSISAAFWINDAGDAVGGSYLAGDQSFDPFLWSHGTMIDLGHLVGCAGAGGISINGSGQVVGESYGCSGPSSLRGYLWENGGPMVDLNSLVQPPSDIVVAQPLEIDDGGDIVSQGILPNGDQHLLVLVPDCDCDEDCEQRVAASQDAQVVPPTTPSATPPPFGRTADWLRNPFGKRAPIPGQSAVPSN